MEILRHDAIFAEPEIRLYFGAYSWLVERRLARQIGKRRLLHIFRFEPADRRPEPGAERFLKLLLCPGAVQGRDSLSGR